jgi:hypothetical protein
VPARIQYGYSVIQALTGNLNFPNFADQIAALSAATDKLSASYTDAQTARQIAKSKTSIQDADDAAFAAVMADIARDVQTDSGGDKAQIESAGFSVRNTPAPVGLPDAPTDVTVVPSQTAGCADVSWKSKRGYRSFTIERAEDAPVPVFQVIGNTTKKYGTFNSMVSGRKYWFRVASVGPAGQSAWSDPVPLFAP